MPVYLGENTVIFFKILGRFNTTDRNYNICNLINIHNS